MSKKMWERHLCAAMLVLMPIPAAAEMLFSVSAGVNRATVETPQLPPVLPIYVAGSASFGRDLTDTSARLTLNLDLPLPFMRFEAGWADLGSHTGTISLTRIDGTVDTFTHTIDADVRWLAYAPSIDLGPLAVSGKVGVAHLKVGGFDGTEALLGASAGYYFDSGLGIRLDAERIGSDATQFGASLSFRF